MQLQVGILVSVSGGFYYSKTGKRVMTFNVFLLNLLLGENSNFTNIKMRWEKICPILVHTLAIFSYHDKGGIMLK